jgi:lysophospholipase L1-like esterase
MEQKMQNEVAFPSHIKGKGSKKKRILLIVSLITNFVLSTLLLFFYLSPSAFHIYECKKSNNAERPDYWAIRGWNSMVAKIDLHPDVMFFGHSQIEMCDFRHNFPGLQIVVSGYPGDNVEGMRLRVEQIASLKPIKVFLLCGANSLEMSDEEFQAKYDQLVNEIKAASPSSELYIFNILPQCDGTSGRASRNGKIVERNCFIKEYTQQNNIPMIDLYSLYTDVDGTLFRDITLDGIHLTPQGYDRWAEALRPYI